MTDGNTPKEACARESAPKAERAGYERPRLTRLGSISEMTQATPTAMVATMDGSISNNSGGL